MPRHRPHLSITLPRNFTFHPNDAEDPFKTPAQDSTPLQPPSSPRPDRPFRVKRRLKPSISSLWQKESKASSPAHHEFPIPSIESTEASPPLMAKTSVDAFSPGPPLHQQDASMPSTKLLTPGLRTVLTAAPRAPRTPEPSSSSNSQGSKWHSQQEGRQNSSDPGDAILRPMSTCSILSDSSDDSLESAHSLPTGDGSCTSPESDVPDPFHPTTSKSCEAKRWSEMTRQRLDKERKLCSRQAHELRNKTYTKWTMEMDRHLWMTYLAYLQDPTVTPFKLLPGVAPPLGVCHRVARQAKHTWRGVRTRSQTPLRQQMSIESSPSASLDLGSSLLQRLGSPDKLPPAKRSRSGTPSAALSSSQSGPWPKSGSSTRRRLRLLCRRKTSIASKHHRLASSRSPSPAAPTPRAPPAARPSHTHCRTRSRLAEVSSPFGPPASSPFNTRGVQISLTTSTSDTMQPDGPLAQLSASSADSTSLAGHDWRQDPPAPFASEATMSSDPPARTCQDATTMGKDSPISPKSQGLLGSPLGFHTWGPNWTKHRSRPSASHLVASSSESSIDSSSQPSLHSPTVDCKTLPYPGTHKRRALQQLEEDVGLPILTSNASGTSAKDHPLRKAPDSSRDQHRRVRSRGFSLDDLMRQSYLQSLSSQAEQAGSSGRVGASDTSRRIDSPGGIVASSSTPVMPDFHHSAGDRSTLPFMRPNETNTIRRLDSPFEGVGPRPRRTTKRHMATTSLGALGDNEGGRYLTINEILGRAAAVEANDDKHRCGPL